MHKPEEYRQWFTWLDEHLKRLMGEAEDFDVGVLDALEEEETARTGCASCTRDNGMQWMMRHVLRIKEHIAAIEGDILELSRLELDDRIELVVREQLRRIREDEESLERFGKTDEWNEEE